MLFYIYKSLYFGLNIALDDDNENRYHSYMRDDNKRPERWPDIPSGLARNDKTPMRVRSETLLGTANELLIEHDGREYRLRLTQNRKLILTA